MRFLKIKKNIMDLLSKFENANLASEAARSKIADEILEMIYERRSK